MSPPEDEDRRPGGETKAAKATQAADLKSDSTLAQALRSLRDAVLDELLRLRPSDMYAASLGYRLCQLDAEQITAQRVGEAGYDVASSPEWRKIKRQPRWAELQRRRGECVHRHRLENCTCGGGGRG